MTNSLRFLTVVCVFLALFCFGCASRPDEQLKAATEAMNQAIEQRAEQYAASDWKSAKEIWDQANDQLAKQNYASAATSLVTAKARFIKARDTAKDERDSTLQQVKDIQASIASQYAAFKAGLTNPKTSPAVKKQIQSACADIDKRIGIVASLVSQGGYIEAKTAAQETLHAIDFNTKKVQGK